MAFPDDPTKWDELAPATNSRSLLYFIDRNVPISTDRRDTVTH